MPHRCCSDSAASRQAGKHDDKQCILDQSDVSCNSCGLLVDRLFHRTDAPRAGIKGNVWREGVAEFEKSVEVEELHDVTQETLVVLRMTPRPFCHGFSQKPGLGLRPVGRGEEICEICTRRPPGRRVEQPELFVCAVVSGFLGRKMGHQDPRTGTQETREPGITGSLHQWRSGGRRP